MTCPTCGHTWHSIGHGMHHCPRCGTQGGSHADGSVTVPALVERCRVFAQGLDTLEPAWKARWQALGIAESIGPVPVVCVDCGAAAMPGSNLCLTCAAKQSASH